jgi:endonuclease/exonuclease/phosphatase (EEP) superfamily protein YafD
MSDVTGDAPSTVRPRWAAPWLIARIAAVWTLSVTVALWAIVRMFGLDRGTLAVQLMAFTPYVALGALVPLVASVLTGRWVAAAISTVALIILASCVLPRAFGSPSTMDGVPVTVMAMNMRLGGADANTIVALVRDRGVDVLAVQEFTPQAQANLAAAGIDAVLPYQHLVAGPGASGSGLYSRQPLSRQSVSVNPGWGFNQAVAVLTSPGARPVEIHSVHPDPPGDGTQWAAGLQAQTPAGPGSPLRILAGDFNSTLDHSALRAVLRTGYRDAADQVGRGFTPTWPYYGPRTAVVPKVTIDHVLVNAPIGVRDFDAVTVPLTDHRAILATVVLPRA